MPTHRYRYQLAGIALAAINARMPPGAQVSAQISALPYMMADLTVDVTGKPDLDAVMTELGWSFVTTDPAEPAYKACTLEQFKAIGDGVADDTTAINDAFAAMAAGTYNVLLLGAGQYLGNWDRTIPDNCGVVGYGFSSRLITTTNAPVLNIGGNNIYIGSLAIVGNNAGPNQIGIKDGDPLVPSSGHSRYLINAVELRGLATGYLFAQNALVNAGQEVGPALTSVTADACVDGFHFATRGEYAKLANCQATNCTGWGAIIGAGNISWVGGGTDVCTNGIDIANDVNDSHGVISGLTINHSTAIALRYSGVNGFTVADCKLFLGTLNIQTNSLGLMLSSPQLSLDQINVAAGTTASIVNALSNRTLTSGITGTVMSVDPTARFSVVNPRFIVDWSIPAYFQPFVQRTITLAVDGDQQLSPLEATIDTVMVPAGVWSAGHTLHNPLTPYVGYQQLMINENANPAGVQFAFSGPVLTIPPGKSLLYGYDGTNIKALLLSA